MLTTASWYLEGKVSVSCMGGDGTYVETLWAAEMVSHQSPAWTVYVLVQVAANASNHQDINRWEGERLFVKTYSEQRKESQQQRQQWLWQTWLVFFSQQDFTDQEKREWVLGQRVGECRRPWRVCVKRDEKKIIERELERWREGSCELDMRSGKPWRVRRHIRRGLDRSPGNQRVPQRRTHSPNALQTLHSLATNSLH